MYDQKRNKEVFDSVNLAGKGIMKREAARGCKSLFLAALLLFCFYGIAGAVELPSVNQSKIRMTIAPGKSQFGEIEVENHTSDTRNMKVYLGDWQYLPAADGSKDFMPPSTLPLSCASWIRFSPTEFTLAPFSKQKISYEVKVPPDATGGHFAVMFFESIFGKLQNDQGPMQAAVNIAVRIGVLFFVEPQGTAQRAGVIDNLAFKNEGAKSESISLDFHNTGTCDITAGGTFHLMDKNGMVQYRGTFNDVYTFPGNTARLKGEYKRNLAPGTYDLIVTIDLGKALEEAQTGRGPVMTKEVEAAIDAQGELTVLGTMR